MADEASHLPSCQRCKLRKIRCDHAAPKCSACLKAATTCVIVDPITLKQYTREYIHDLERKEKHLSEKARKRLGPRRTSNARSPRDPPSAESTTTFGGYVGENSSLKLVSNVENGALISSNVCFKACCSQYLQIPNGALDGLAKQDQGRRYLSSPFLRMLFHPQKKLLPC